MPVAGKALDAEEEAAGNCLIAPIGERGDVDATSALQAPVLDTGKEVTESHGSG
jgi:hypothetical protein